MATVDVAACLFLEQQFSLSVSFMALLVVCLENMTVTCINW